MKLLNLLYMLTVISSRYYTISMILGTVALAYGSVPLYKMVRLDHHGFSSDLRVLD